MKETTLAMTSPENNTAIVMEADESGPPSASTKEPQKAYPEDGRLPPAALDIEHAVVADDPRKWSPMRKVRSLTSVPFSGFRVLISNNPRTSSL